MNMKKIIPSFLIIFFIINSCTLSPGMSIPNTGLLGGSSLYIKSLDKFVDIISINNETIGNINSTPGVYRISTGDSISVTVWGQEEAFPLQSNFQINHPQNTRIVDNDGSIFFPYVGRIKIEGMTLSETREILTNELNKSFVDVQLDVTITKFNLNQRVFILGEIKRPQPVEIALEPITLSMAISEVGGIDEISSDPSNIYLIRNNKDNQPLIYKIDLKDPSSFFIANQVILEPRDIVFVGAASITKWNRFVGQLFPFASFINQIDQIEARE